MKEEEIICSFCKTIVINIRVVEKNDVIICENCIKRIKHLLNEDEKNDEKEEI